MVHADETEKVNTLINHIQAYLYQKREWNPRWENAFTPALCNRIDRNTGGIVIAAKNAETLRIINEKIRAPRFIREGLREISFGDLEGLSDDVIMERYADFFAARASMKQDLPYPGGESAADVIRRAVPVMDEIAKSGAETVAVVTHGGVIRSLVTHYLHMDGAYVPLLARHLENCGITEFYYRESDGEMLLNRFNDFAHLMDEPELLRGGWGEKK